MIKINQRIKHGMKVVDVYYAQDNQGESEYDAVLYIQNKTAIKGATEFNTVLIDLEKSEEMIFTEFGKHLRRGIRKMDDSDEVEYFIDFEPSHEMMEEFIKFFEGFSKSRGIYGCDIVNLYQLRDVGCLAIEGAREKKSGQVLVFHTYVFDDIRCRMQYSASINYLFPEDNKKRNMISNINRALTWKGIKTFKSRGFKEFDLGGVTLNGYQKAMEGIDRFKMEFGGKLVTEYHYYQGKSSKGKLLLSLKSMQGKVIKT